MPNLSFVAQAQQSASIAAQAAKNTVSNITGAGNAAQSSDSNGSSDYGITREAWSIASRRTPAPIEFNINPNSIDWNFQGRGSANSGAKGRLINRFRANRNMGYFDMDVSFQMQSGNMLTPDGSAAKGHITLFSILELMNEDVIFEGGLNYQTLKFNTHTFGYMEAKGFLAIENGLTINESAEDPFRRQYTLVFQIFQTIPTITSKDQLLAALTGKSNGSAAATPTAATPATSANTATTPRADAGAAQADPRLTSMGDIQWSDGRNYRQLLNQQAAGGDAQAQRVLEQLNRG